MEQKEIKFKDFDEITQFIQETEKQDDCEVMVGIDDESAEDLFAGHEAQVKVIVINGQNQDEVINKLTKLSNVKSAYGVVECGPDAGYMAIAAVAQAILLNNTNAQAEYSIVLNKQFNDQLKVTLLYC